VVYLITRVMADAMTRTTIVPADGILATAAANLETSGNFRIARSACAKTQNLRRKVVARVRNNAGWWHMSVMVVATITTTIVDVIGIRETAVGRPAIRGNSCTAANVNAWTQVSRREAVLVNVEVPTSRLTAVVTTKTTTAGVTGTAVTAAAHPATSDSGPIAASASVWTRNSRRQANVPVTREAVWPQIG